MPLTIDRCRMEWPPGCIGETIGSSSGCVEEGELPSRFDGCIDLAGYLPSVTGGNVFQKWAKCIILSLGITKKWCANCCSIVQVWATHLLEYRYIDSIDLEVDNQSFLSFKKPKLVVRFWPYIVYVDTSWNYGAIIWIQHHRDIVE